MSQELIIVCLLGGLIATDTTAAFQVLVSHPLVACTLVGLLMHDATLGLTVGILLELPWLAEMPIGGVRINEGNVGSLVAAALAIHVGNQTGRPDSALFLATVWGVIVAYLGGTLVIAKRNLNVRLIHKADRAALRGSTLRVSLYHFIGVGHSFITGILIASIGILFGLQLLMSAFEVLPARVDPVLSLAKPVLIGIGCGAIAAMFLNRKTSWAIVAGLAVGLLLVLV